MSDVIWVRNFPEPTNPARLDELESPLCRAAWKHGYEWGHRDSDSEHTFDRFNEAEELLENLQSLALLIKSNTNIQPDNLIIYNQLKTFFEKRIEDNA